jgi:SAM-dependent methyltransferase
VRDAESWQPSRFALERGRLVPSRDPARLGLGSRLAAGSVGRFYSDHLAAHCRGSLLDLGCGSVPYYAAYRDLVDDVVCVDWAKSRHENRHLDHECDLNGPLPLADASFDTVILSDVLEHLPEPMVTWREIARVLRPGGKLLFNVPFFYWIHESPHDYYRYTEFALRRFAAESGFAVRVLEPLGGVPEILADVLAKTLAERRFGRPLAGLVQSGCQWLVSTGFGARFSRASAERFPLGYFGVVERDASAGPAD